MWRDVAIKGCLEYGSSPSSKIIKGNQIKFVMEVSYFISPFAPENANLLSTLPNSNLFLNSPFALYFPTLPPPLSTFPPCQSCPFCLSIAFFLL